MEYILVDYSHYLRNSSSENTYFLLDVLLSPIAGDLFDTTISEYEIKISAQT